jgi:hypothetical protein
VCVHAIPCSFVYSLTTYRYRFGNLIFTSIFPGPKEQDADQVQRLIRLIVNELLRLWKDGIWVKTNKHPLGRLVRIILLCVCCDKPAAHKMGGFASHSHTFFCTRCWIKQEQKATKQAFERDGKLLLSYPINLKFSLFLQGFVDDLTKSS